MHSFRLPSRWLCVFYALAIFGSTISPGITFAGPSTENPTELFEVRDEAMSQEYWERCRVAIDIIMMVSQKIEDAQAAGNISVVPPREVSEAFVMVDELTFCAGKLNILGEPCGRHFHLLANDIKGVLLRFISAYLEIPGVKERLFSEGSRRNLERVVKTQVGKVKRLQGLIRKQEWRELDEELHQIGIELDRYLCWYPGQSIDDPVLKQIYELRNQYGDEINGWYKDQANEVLARLSAEYTPNFGVVLDNLNGAVDAIEKSGSVTWNNRQMSGPEVVVALTEDVKQTQVDAIRFRGIEISHSVSSPGIDTTLYNLTTSQQQFVQGVMEGIGQVVSKDAARVSGIEAETLYREYLTALTEMLSLIDDEALKTPIERAMLELAGKSESFAEDVETYTDATGDLLRWRERTATALVKNVRTRGEQQVEYIAMGELFASRQIGKQQRIRGEDIDVDIRTWIDELELMQQEFIGKPVVVSDLILSEKQKKLLSPVNDLRCATVDMPQSATREMTLLLADLQSSEADSFPLSLQGQMALYHALHYDYDQVGGTLTKVEFEDRITMMSRCDAGDMARERLTRFEDTRNVDLNIFLDRSISIGYVTPDWVRSKYFFAYFDKQK